ncbi:MAG TPA: pyridoxal-dependent decarboxylase [Agriterribacter sp.]|nr:pyridoxal-dependent decarboxylase [Agriterribacter sp.]
MYHVLQSDLAALEQLLEEVTKESTSYLQDIPQADTSVPGRIHFKRELENEGRGGLLALKEFQERFRSVIAASSGPRYWGFVTGGTTPASIMGDWLTAVYDQNTQATKGHGDNSAWIELEAIHLLLQLFQLPQTYFGGFVTGATMSNFTCLGVARQWIGKVLGADIAKDGLVAASPIKILSATPHSSAIKSLSMLGLGSRNFISLKTAEGNRECIDIPALEEKIKLLQGEPFILVSSGGTVNSGDFDDFKAIGKLKSTYNFWWHIDAAFGAFASCSPLYKHLVDGWENADSITVDCHKWLNVPYENAVFLVQDKHRILQAETYQNSNAPYLGNAEETFNYLNFLPENSRRLKALPAWFTLVAYGREGYRSIVENNIQLAKQLGMLISGNDELELLAPVRLNIVPFTVKGMEENEIDTFLQALNSRGKVFMTPTVYRGRKGIRAALVNWRTTTQDVQMTMTEIQETLDIIKKGILV